VKTKTKHKVSCLNADVKLRRFPFPYRSMLAICSDLDDTPDKEVYTKIMQFLNTTDMTPMGQGVGLEVGNSIHFHAKPQIFSYWSTDDAGREMIQTLIHSGHIDCLHSFGELITSRNYAEQALEELKKHDCKLEVWVDHGGAVTNFGFDIMQGHGDEVGHPAYHADLTIDYGIKYVWCGRTTSIIGQNSSGGIIGIFNWHHPMVSSKTLLKETTKRILARAGNTKYAMHLTNELMRPYFLRDGNQVYEFIRCNPHWAGVSSCDQGRYIGDVLTNNVLNQLINRSGTCILYTHLGRIDNRETPFNKKAVIAFRRLSEEFHSGRILVTTTRRLLGFHRAVREIDYNSQWVGDNLRIILNKCRGDNSLGELSIADLSGLTFYVPNPKQTRITIDGQEVTNLIHNAPDHTGRPSLSLPWHFLEFPKI
jgi:hypothetical protein